MDAFTAVIITPVVLPR